MTNPEKESAEPIAYKAFSRELPDHGDDILSIYYDQMRKLPLINAEEEVRLGQLIDASGIKNARKLLNNAAKKNKELDPRVIQDCHKSIAEGTEPRNILVEANLRLVIFVIDNFFKSGYDDLPALGKMDLIQAGNEVLIEAAENWSYGLGLKFSSYAVPCIRGGILSEMGERWSTVYVRPGKRQEVNRVIREQRRFYEEKSREATDGELCEALDISLWDLERLKAIKEVITPGKITNDGDIEASIEEADDYNSGYTPQLRKKLRNNLVYDKDIFTVATFSLFQEAVESVLAALKSADDKKEKEDNNKGAGILRLRFGILHPDYPQYEGKPLTIDEIGDIYGIHRERVRQIEAKVMSKLRHPHYSRSLRDFLD